jgi:Bacterial Ig-like domain (group 3)
VRRRSARPGRIGLQTHGAGDDVYFRNVRIKDLTPVPLRDSTTTATADPAQVTVGSGSNVTVTVDAPGASPTGEVQLKAGDVVLGSGTLAGGRVTIPTGAFDSAGTRTLTAAYAGDATTRASSGNVDIAVVPSTVNPGGGQPVSRPAIGIRGGKANANGRRSTAAIRMRCSDGANACRGAVRLRVGKRTIGTGRFRIAAGDTDTVRVKLNRKARELLAQRKRVRATLAITYADGRTKRVRLDLTR